MIITTIFGTILVLLISSVTSIISIQQREIEPGNMNPTDQILFTRGLLDTSLVGIFLLFFMHFNPFSAHLYVK